jgi:hypothetical protein
MMSARPPLLTTKCVEGFICRGGARIPEPRVRPGRCRRTWPTPLSAGSLVPPACWREELSRRAMRHSLGNALLLSTRTPTPGGEG